jgi:hypothetical protein
VLFFAYDGTVDTCDPRLHDSFDAALDTYNRDASPFFPSISAAAHASVEPVELATRYGRGFAWTGWASRTTREITAGRQPLNPQRDATASGRCVTPMPSRPGRARCGLMTERAVTGRPVLSSAAPPLAPRC